MSEVKVKGNSLRRNFEVLGELYGADVVPLVIAELTPLFRDAVRSRTVLHGSWYPIEWVNEFHRAMAAVLPHVTDGPEAISRRGVEHDTKGVYGFLAKLVSPEFAMKQAPRVLGTYYKGPVITPTIIEHGHADVRFGSCHGFGRALWRDTAAGAQRILEQAGARSVRLSFVHGGREGDSSATLDVRWL